MINGDHRTPGGRGNYLSCGISWPLSATHGASALSPRLASLGFSLMSPSKNWQPTCLVPGQPDPASGYHLLLRGLQANLDFLAWSGWGGA